MRKIILGLAVTLDGLIEGPNGEYDWCLTDQDYGMGDFLKRIDAIFYGRKSYEMMMGVEGGNPFAGIKGYVFSNTLKDIKDGFELVNGDIIKKVLPVLDDLERALQNRPSNSGAWVSGIELIQKKLLSMLEAEGVKRIEAVGVAFDPNFHEAISHEPIVGVQSGHVIAVVQNGYMLGERVIRPALVRVAQ